MAETEQEDPAGGVANGPFQFFRAIVPRSTIMLMLWSDPHTHGGRDLNTVTSYLLGEVLACPRPFGSELWANSHFPGPSTSSPLKGQLSSKRFPARSCLKLLH